MVQSIKDKLTQLHKEIPSSVSLVAVSKTKPIADIQEAYDAGQRIFGENKIQEMLGKYEVLPKDIEWHMIGHLQRNKVKYMASFVSLIHGVDSLKTLQEINKQAKKHQRTINCLLQVRIAKEETKFGLTKEETEAILTSDAFKELKNIKVIGFMGMATFTEELDQINDEFSSLQQFYEKHKQQHHLNVLSMGMSGDYQLAIQNGSTMIRVGSAIFGERNYIA
ncbi:YggS family pyridoxal phosphate enzyme [Polaribacter pacificus]|uniref:Pyridoxal phosphate homeostasis protein n=1 Tax=Polaribacter pacificus TaxID=1775173 RepID=A0A917HYZ5_9FLAO|nr:YggS family pyridoxal phosphate-dependent enzyme [Polaribacter pacificus]GGG99242.1 YggS family pyridoxal phosphate enzyme [Polaribacter pacificus]